MDRTGGEYSKEKKLFAMATMILSIPLVLLQRVRAFIVFPGVGEIWRIGDAVAWWENKENVRAEFFLIPGMNLRERTAITLNVEVLKEKFGLVREENVIIRPHAEHTKDQAEWAREKIEEYGISSIALFVSPYHITRAYLTLLKSLLNKKIFIPIIPVPAYVAPHVEIPETGVNAWEMIPGEVERIEDYQKKGDTATFEELQNYLDQFWKSNIV